MSKNKNKKQQTTYIGGQAVTEGVMMRGRTCMVTSVRDGDGNIQTEAIRLKPPEKQLKLFRIPIFRGMKSMWESLIGGTKLTMRAAEVYADDDDSTDTSKWEKGKNSSDSMGAAFAISVVLGLIVGIGLFFFLPTFIAGLIATFAPEVITTGGLIYNLIVGVVRILIFIGYIAFTSLMKTIRRTYMYHGAEHKTITCYESGMPLTVENVKKCRRVHDRCGTTFMFLVMVVSILVCALVSALVKMIPGAASFFVSEGTLKQRLLSNVAMFLIHLACIPLVAGISYEILRALAKTKNKFFYIFKAPGLALQKLTTREPDDDMIECAINSFNKVLEMDADPNVPESSFVLSEKLSVVLDRAKKRFAQNGIEEVEAEWICALALNIPKSSLPSYGGNMVSKKDNKLIADTVAQRLTGRPLWYIIGDASFCGYTIKVDERVLIPRPETEVLVSLACKYAGAKTSRVLDLCTGSGAIAIAFAKRFKGEVDIVASDISAGAIELATENAKLNQVDYIRFIQSDMFEKIRGKFDLIISNPPYIESTTIPTLQREVRDYEPRLALDGGEDGLDFYRRIAEELPCKLNPEGVLLMECGEGQARKIAKLFAPKAKAIIIKDFNGVERYVKVQLVDYDKKA